MPDWNKSFPAVLGLEWMPTREGTRSVSPGPPAMQRMTSTTAETIESLTLPARANPAETRPLRTVVDIIPEGQESVDFTGPVQFVDLVPNADVELGTWTDLAGGTTDIYTGLTSGIVWPDPAVEAAGIQDETGFANYRFQVDASAFAGGGGLEDARICRVELALVAQAVGGGFRQIRTAFRNATTGTTNYDPGGGNQTSIHGFGGVLTRIWGEINPLTGRPWLPADIAAFDGGDWTILIRSETASPTNTPTIYSAALRVHYLETENRVAAAVWERPTSISADRITVTTDSITSLPDGATTWSKPGSGDFLLWWRQAHDPPIHTGGPATDIRWQLLIQDLGPAGNPSSVVFPLTTDGTPPAPAGVLAFDSRPFSFPQGGTEPFQADGQGATGFGLDTAGGPSDDSQPYREMGPTSQPPGWAQVTSSQKVGQQVTPSAGASYLGVRTVIIPPNTGNPTLRVAVHRVSDGQQVGGQLVLSADEVRALPEIAGAQVSGQRLRFIEGFLSAAAPLTASVDYEVRLTATGGVWTALAPFSNVAEAASFSGTAGGAFIGPTLFTDRDLVVNLLIQPDPPQNFTAAPEAVPVETYACSATEIEHMRLDWDPGANPLGSAFARYEVERQLLPDVAGTPCAPTQPSMLLLDGSAGANMTTPDSEAFTVGAQQLQAVVELAPDTWSPAGGELVVGQWPNTAGENSWVLALTAAGELNFAFGDASGDFDAGNQRTSAVHGLPDGAWRFARVTFTPNDGTGTLADSMDGAGDSDTVDSTSHVAPSVAANAIGDLLICAWQSWEGAPQTYTAPGGMTQGPTTTGFWNDCMAATEVLGASGATGTRTATYGTADAWSAASTVVFGDGSSPVIEESLSGQATDDTVTLTTDPSTQAGWWLVAVHAVDFDPDNQMGQPSGSGWQLVADSGFQASGTSRMRMWARRLETGGAKAVTFPLAPSPGTSDVHARLFVLSNVLTVDNDITRFEQSQDGVSWTQIGSDIVTASGGVTLFDSAEDLIVGGAGGQELTGRVRQASVSVGGVPVASPDVTGLDPGEASLTDTQSNLWTVNGAAQVVEDPEAPPIIPTDPACAWTLIARITSSEGTTTFLDRELPRGIEALYRVRVVATTGAFSDWVVAGPVEVPASGCVMIFTSNEQPELEVVHDYEPESSYPVLSNAGDELLPIAGADYQVAFMEPETRGLGWRTTVTANFGTQPTDRDGMTVGGPAVFRPLLDIARSLAIPYVCVLDKDGNRWLGHVELTDPAQNQPGHRYPVDVVITPTRGDSLPAED